MLNEKISDMKQKIKDFIRQDILLGDQSFEINDDTALIEDNIIDSINLMRLISFLEKNMNVTYSQDDYAIDNFNTINNIVGMINSKAESVENE